MNDRKPHAIVIGAGLGGLAIALRLAARGWRVTVCEQSPSVGGKMNCWETHGFRFDTGPSLITLPAVFDDFFADIGERRENHFQWIRVDPIAEYCMPDGTRFRQEHDLARWLTTIRALESDAVGYLTFMALGARRFLLSRDTFLMRSPWEPPNGALIRALRNLPLTHAWGRYDDSVKRFFRSAALQRMFLRYATYVGSSPYRMPAMLMVIPYLEQLHGVWHVAGGLYRVVESLFRLGREAGVEYRLGERVEEILRRNGRAAGVRLRSGEELDARVVIMNGDASRLPDLLGERPPSAWRRRERSLSGFVLLLAVRRTLAELPHHAVYFSADYAEEFRQLFEERRFPDDPTVYVSIPSRTDRSMTPGEGEVVFVMANAPADENARWDEHAVAEALQRIWARLRKGGFPDIQSDVLASAVWTPRDFAERYDMPGGALYGWASHGWRNAFLRPPNRVARVPGLYCVGGSSHPGGGTPMVLLSAKITDRLIRRYERD